jgi:hypothetical protein
MTKSETDLCHFQEGGHLSFAIQDSDFIGRWVFRHSSFHPDLLRTNLPLPTWVFGSEPQDVTRGTSKTTSRMSHVGHGAGTTRRHTRDIQNNLAHVPRGTRGRNHEMSHVGHPQLPPARHTWDTGPESRDVTRGTSTVTVCKSHVGQEPDRISLGISSFLISTKPPAS